MNASSSSDTTAPAPIPVLTAHMDETRACSSCEENVPGKDSRPAWRSRLVLVAKLCVAGGLLSWLLFSGQLDLRQLAAVRLSRELGSLLILTVGSMALPALRWWWLLRVQQLWEPLGTVIALTWTGYFAALVLPGAASGDLAKSYLILRRQAKARARAFSTILADRFIGVHSLLCLGSLSILWLVRHGKMTPAVGAMAGSMLALLLGSTLAVGLLLLRKLLLRVLPGHWRVAWNESFELYGAAKGAFLGCFVLSVASNAMAIACFAVSGSLLGDAVQLDATFLVGPLVILANCLPLSPGVSQGVRNFKGSTVTMRNGVMRRVPDPFWDKL